MSIGSRLVSDGAGGGAGCAKRDDHSKAQDFRFMLNYRIIIDYILLMLWLRMR